MGDGSDRQPLGSGLRFDKIVGALKRAENEDYYDRDTDFNPFTLRA